MESVWTWCEYYWHMILVISCVPQDNSKKILVLELLVHFWAHYNKESSMHAKKKIACTKFFLEQFLSLFSNMLGHTMCWLWWYTFLSCCDIWHFQLSYVCQYAVSYTSLCEYVIYEDCCNNSKDTKTPRHKPYECTKAILYA